jgi:hypothetical protein
MNISQVNRDGKHGEWNMNSGGDGDSGEGGDEEDLFPGKDFANRGILRMSK